MKPGMQRLRVKFSRGEEVKYITHLDLMRLWERILRRAGISLAYSEGFTPHPRISLAAPLPLGVTSEAELLDVFLAKKVSPYFLFQAINRQLPRGIEVSEVREILWSAPSLQSQVRYAEYRVEMKTNKSPEEVQEAITTLLQAGELPWHHRRDTGVRHYDLRSLVQDLWLIDWKDFNFILGMRLRCDPGGAGRPEQVTQALGFPDYPESIHRTKLLLAGGK